VDEVALPEADDDRDGELPIPRLHDVALSSVFCCDIGDTVLGHALRRMLADLDNPQEAYAAFGNVPR
jgi:FXSXX-COOH protein